MPYFLVGMALLVGGGMIGDDKMSLSLIGLALLVGIPVAWVFAWVMTIPDRKRVEAARIRMLEADAEVDRCLVNVIDALAQRHL
jgi:hypothetical protein